MPEFIIRLFANKKISTRKRVLNPISSALASFILPGSAQAVNGQYIKGILLLLLWLSSYSLAEISAFWFTVVQISQYVIRIAVSSDAYFISSRMKLGEQVRSWSVMFFKMEPPTEGPNAYNRNFSGKRTLITDANIIDGTGSPAFRADVLLEGEYIHYIRPHINRKENEYTVIDAEGMYLIPGFINPCCCNEGDIFSDIENTAAISQGFTTEIAGHGGISHAPVRENDTVTLSSAYAAYHSGSGKEKFFSNTGLYLMELEKLSTVHRHESMIGYISIRRAVLGKFDKAINRDELQKLCRRVTSALECGAKGISFDMGVYPRISDDEIAAVMSAVGRMNSVAAFKLPLGERKLLPELKRVCTLAQSSGAKILIINIHAFGSDREKAGEFLKVVDDARSSGVDIRLCITGLPHTVTGLFSLTPYEMWNDDFTLSDSDEADKLFAERIKSVGGANKITILNSGDTLLKIAERSSEAIERTAIRLMQENQNDVSVIIESDDCNFAAELFEKEYTSLCTDDRPISDTDCTIPHFLGRYTGEKLSLCDAVSRCTMKQAAEFGIWDRGLIREGMIADLVLLAPERFPCEISGNMTRGIVKVWSMGRLQYDSSPSFDVSTLQKRGFMGLPIGR